MCWTCFDCTKTFVNPAVRYAKQYVKDGKVVGYTSVVACPSCQSTNVKRYMLDSAGKCPRCGIHLTVNELFSFAKPDGTVRFVCTNCDAVSLITVKHVEFGVELEVKA